MAEPERRAITVPMHIVDRANFGVHLSMLIGPLTMCRRAEFVDAMVALAEIGPQTRVGLQFTPGGRGWSYDPSRLREQCEAAVIETGEPGPEVFERLVSEFALAGDSVPPLRYVLTPDHLIQLIDHSLGDADLMTLVPETILAMAAGAPVPDWAYTAQLRDPLSRAVVETFVKHPGRIITLLRSRRVPPATVASPIADSDWRSKPAMKVVTIPERTASTMRARLRAREPRPAITAHLAVLLHRAFVCSGFEVAPETTVVVNLRRYLPPGFRTLGNFITGVPVIITGSEESASASVSAQIADAERAARPLAQMMLAAVRRGRGRHDVVTGPPVSPVIQLSYSNAGPQFTVERLPWSARDGRLALAVSLGHPQQLSVLTSIVGGTMTLTASFDAAVFDPAQVESAMQYLADHALDSEGSLDHADT